MTTGYLHLSSLRLGVGDKASIGMVPVKARITLGSGQAREGSGYFLAVTAEAGSWALAGY